MREKIGILTDLYSHKNLKKYDTLQADLQNYDLIAQSGFQQRKFYAKKTQIRPHVYLQKTA